MNVGVANGEEVARRLAAKAGAAAGATAVYWFGSGARGEGNSGSDVDLLLVLRDDCDVRGSLARAHSVLWPRDVAVDLVPMREGHFYSLASVLARRVAREGVLVYGG